MIKKTCDDVTYNTLPPDYDATVLKTRAETALYDFSTQSMKEVDKMDA